MVADLDTLGRSLTTLDVSELTMLPRFTPDDAARWPAVLSERARAAVCVVARDHDAALSTTIGHPHSGEPQWWLDLCVAHAEELTERFGYRIDTSGTAATATDDDAAGDGSEHPLAAVLADAADGRTDPGAPAVAGWLGDPPVQVGLLAVASHRAPMLRGGLTLGGEPDPAWAPFRRRVLTYRDRSTSTEGHIDSGLGPADRMEVYPRLQVTRKGGSAAGREVVAAARSLAPDARHVFGTAPVHDTAAIRVLLDASFTPIGTEALFLTRPRAGTGAS